jgi:hypothetical protein
MRLLLIRLSLRAVEALRCRELALRLAQITEKILRQNRFMPKAVSWHGYSLMSHNLLPLRLT